MCNETRKADAATRHVVTSDITQSNKLAGAVTHWVGTKERLENEDKRQPWWKRWIEVNIKNLRKDSNLLERENKSETRWV